MRLTFLLPGPGLLPIGGFRVVYEYAGRMAQRGHDVTVVHAPLLGGDGPALPRVARERLLYAKYRLFDWRPDAWMTVDPHVRMCWVPGLTLENVPDGDAVCATAWQTARAMASLPARKGAHVYLVQHHETWSAPPNVVDATWRLPAHKVVIARWLEELDEGIGGGGPVTYIPNGLDLDAFTVRTPPEDRDGTTVLMMYSDQAWKGSADGVAALRAAEAGGLALRVTLFGVPDRPRDLPGTWTYVQLPSPERLHDLYDDAAVFVAPSWTEGFPLPPAEAMMSGCAVVATDIGGHREYATPEETALVVPPRDPQAMAAAIRRLVTDASLRHRLAWKARANIEQFTWDRAAGALEDVFRSVTITNGRVAARH